MLMGPLMGPLMERQFLTHPARQQPTDLSANASWSTSLRALQQYFRLPFPDQTCKDHWEELGILQDANRQGTGKPGFVVREQEKCQQPSPTQHKKTLKYHILFPLFSTTRVAAGLVSAMYLYPHM